MMLVVMIISLIYKVSYDHNFIGAGNVEECFDVITRSTWYQTARWRMHSGLTWHPLSATTIICCVVSSRSLIWTWQCLSTSTTLQSPRPVSSVI